MNTLRLPSRSVAEPLRLGDGIALLRGFADTATLMPLIERVARTRAVPPSRDTRRADDVRGDDQLRAGGLGQRSQRVSLQLARSADRSRLAALCRTSSSAWRLTPPTRARISRVRARCLPHQPLRGRRAAHRASRCRRAELRAAHRLGIAGIAGELRVLRARRAAARAAGVALVDGDVLVWGGPSRLVYHAVRPIKPGTHPLTGEFRYNLTFRHAR